MQREWFAERVVWILPELMRREPFYHLYARLIMQEHSARACRPRVAARAPVKLLQAFSLRSVPACFSTS